MTTPLHMRDYYPRNYKGPLYNPKLDLIRAVNREAYAMIPDRPTAPIPAYVRPNTKHWTELNLRAFLWSLAP